MNTKKENGQLQPAPRPPTQADKPIPSGSGATPIQLSPTIEDSSEIRRAVTRLEATPGYADWLARQPWKMREVVRAVPPNLFYKLRKGPFPAQVLAYCWSDQMVTLKLFVHSIHSPRVVFDVNARDLRPYRELPRDWQILLGRKFPPLFDLTKLPAGALEPDPIDRDESYDRKRPQRDDPNRRALRTLARTARWLLW